MTDEAEAMPSQEDRPKAMEELKEKVAQLESVITGKDTKINNLEERIRQMAWEQSCMGCD